MYTSDESALLDEERAIISKVMRSMGRRGGKAQAAAMTPEERREWARKGQAASVIARKRNKAARQSAAKESTHERPN